MTLALAAGTLFVGGDGRDFVVGGRDRLFLFLDWQSWINCYFFCSSQIIAHCRNQNKNKHTYKAPRVNKHLQQTVAIASRRRHWWSTFRQYRLHTISQSTLRPNKGVYTIQSRPLQFQAESLYIKLQDK